MNRVELIRQSIHPDGGGMMSRPTKYSPYYEITNHVWSSVYFPVFIESSRIAQIIREVTKLRRKRNG